MEILHEFIAAIDLQRQGRLSQKNFIKCRVDSIPAAIYRDIYQQLLKISDFSQNNNKPVIIGQELKYKQYKQQTWSMIAVVTKEIDNQREILLYRYLITDGLGKIPVLIYWYNNHKDDSFDFRYTQYFAQAHFYNNPNLPQTPSLDKFQGLLQNARNHQLIVPYDHNYPPIIFHQLAETIKKGHDLTAWAYNVENINYPQKFQVIYPNSSDSANKFDNILYGHLRRFKNHKRLNKIMAIFLQKNQQVTQIINNIYQALVMPVTYSRWVLIGIGLVGGIIITPTLGLMLFRSFNVGLGWLFFILVIFFMGSAIGRRLD